MNKDDFEHLKALEESLWRAETRFNQEYMNDILHPDFFEFGRSGRMYTRDETLATPTQEIKTKLPLENFNVRFVTADVALVTYTGYMIYDEPEVGNRSSLWQRNDTGWRLRFHQGTPV